MNRCVFTVLWSLLVISLGKESGIIKSKGSKSKSKSDDSSHGYSIIDEITFVENQCCSDRNPDCCVALTWSNSTSKAEHVPPEFGGQYFCENFEITVSQGCDSLDYIFLPVSKSCDFTRVLWSVRCDGPSSDSPDRDCNGFMRAQVLIDGEIVLNNADEFMVSPSDDDNPTGYHALKVPIDSDEDRDTDATIISICTQLQWGDVIQDIDGKDIEIGYSVNSDMFSCANSSIRDICSIDASLAKSVDKAQNIALNVMNLHGAPKAEDGVRLNGAVSVFEYYWNQYIGIGMAVFAASIFFNIVMCIYWSGYRKSYGNESQDAMSKVMIDSDDQTETESDDSDEADREDPLFI